MKKILPILFIVILFVSCKKDSEVDENLWNLTSYTIEYFDSNDIKVFEESPAELSRYEKIIMSNTGFNFIPQSAKSEKKGNNKTITHDVKLSSFYGKSDYDGVVLGWTTVSEESNSHFILQRSDDGAEFIDIGKIMGSGNSNSINNYKFLDNNPFEGINYYRLKEVDFDRNEHYFSHIIALKTISLVNNEYPLVKDGEYYHLPISLYNNRFQKIEIKKEGNNLMKWESREMEVSYSKDGTAKTAAYAKLFMGFRKI